MVCVLGVGVALPMNLFWRCCRAEAGGSGSLRLESTLSTRDCPDCALEKLPARLIASPNHTSPYLTIRQDTSRYDRIRQDTSAIRQHTSASVSALETRDSVDCALEKLSAPSIDSPSSISTHTHRSHLVSCGQIYSRLQV